MRETQRHKDAFEYWLSLGGGTGLDDCIKVAQEFHISKRTFWNWYNELNWANRRDIRLNARAKKLEEKVDNNVVDRKAKELAEIAEIKAIAIGTIKATIDVTKEKLDKLKVKIETPHELAVMIKTYKELVTLEQLLIGEDTERGSINEDAYASFINGVIAKGDKDAR